MNLDEIRTYVNQRLNKDYSGDALPPVDFENYARVANLEYLKTKMGLPERFRFGKNVDGQGFELNAKISDDIRFLIMPMGSPGVPPMFVNKDGIAPLPEDYAHMISSTYKYYKEGEDARPVPIERLTNQQWATRRGSILKQPTKFRPVCTFINNKIHFAPKSLQRVEFTYIRFPAEPVYAQKENTTEGIMEYDHANSIQFEWPEQCHSDLAAMILSYAAEHLQMGAHKQYAESRKEKGN